VGGAPADDARTVRVAVASNFRGVQEALAEAFGERTGHRVVASSGSTGTLHAQIVNGAPFHVLLAADTLRPARLEAEARAVPGSRFTYALGRLVLWGSQAGPGRAEVGPGLLASPGLERLALANPRTAPYGAAAAQVLERFGLPTAAGPLLVTGESVQQAWQFARTGAVDGALVALSLVAGEPLGSYWVVPDSLHAPLRQDAVLLGGAAGHGPALAYLAFLRTPEARAIIRAAGYGLPDGDAG